MHTCNTVTCNVPSLSSSSKFRFIDAFTPAKTPVKWPQGITMPAFCNVTR